MIDLDRIERLVREDVDAYDSVSDGGLLHRSKETQRGFDVLALITEVRALRAGLEEALDEMADGMSFGHKYSADIEALEKLAGIESRHSCSQCGWSGRSFHACEGVPGGFGDE